MSSISLQFLAAHSALISSRPVHGTPYVWLTMTAFTLAVEARQISGHPGLYLIAWADRYLTRGRLLYRF
jgi:hypothetical protein